MNDPAPTGDALADRRLYPREQVSEHVRLVGSTGHVFDANVVDRSLRGLRIRLSDAATIPTEVHVLSRAQQVVYAARVVWRTPPYAGLSISAATDMRALPNSGSARVHKLWRQHIGR